MTRVAVVVRGLGLDEPERQELRDAAGPGVELRFPAEGESAGFGDVGAVIGRISDAELASAPAPASTPITSSRCRRAARTGTFPT
jgi:hypothetical protein